MKKISTIILVNLLLISCAESLLDTVPHDRYTEDVFWRSEEKAHAGLVGCYQILTKDGIFGSATPLWEETATPNAYNYDNSAGFGAIASGTHSASNAATGSIIGGIIRQRWSDCYKGIGRCNTLLARIDDVNMDESLKTRMKAEARFLRALYYSLLQMYYGGVPLILDPPDLDTQGLLPRNSREQVVEQILKDLDEAAAVLPVKYVAATDLGRATRGAALALKARILLFDASPLNNASNDKSKWSAAAAAAREVIDLSEAGYALYPDYRNLFLAAYENNSEVIFDVQYIRSTPSYGSSFDLICRQYNTNAPIQNMIDAYEMRDGLPKEQSFLYNPSTPYNNRDPRMYQTIVYPGDQYIGAVTSHTAPFKITGYGVKKYSIYDKAAIPNTTPESYKSEINYQVIRYADVLLMYAEAQNEASGPDASVYKAINDIRQRAGLNPYEIAGGKSQSEMREIIRHERRIELAFEGFYYTDIRRWMVADQVMNGLIYNSRNQPLVNRTFDPNRDYWWPIPQAEIDLDPSLEQNPNY